ncbi:LysM peptidoglycan-binding domain-containing protein [Glaciibacter psychrotolerans]|uniref:LysM repeat protein n=1 Tax=Glaciibacter psychrotolerans TaxID=670054 RepID=A0A7Z0EE72_9MICO|nr:LysM domain-containing protein [Leifsonia psychrotolerans]NYJ19905.1 LysM repeat protein [Leifsonia psychrotolerans]
MGVIIHHASVRRSTHISVVFALLLSAPLVLGLSGCMGTPTAQATVTVTPTPPATSPRATPSPTPTPTPEPIVVAEPELVPNPPVGQPIPNAPAPIVEPGPAVDLGATPGAEGSTTSDGSGNLLTYTVVSGDTFFDIAQRFDVPVQQFLHMNPSVPGLGEDIYINQIINLDWTAKR